MSLNFSKRTPERCACALWLSVASSTPFCAQDAHKHCGPACCDLVLLQARHSAHGMCIILLCVGAFRIIFLHNERLLIAFLVCLIWHMVLPHYCAVRLKEMYLNYTAYIFLCKYIACFPWMYFTTIQRAIYNFCTRFSPTLIHISLFPNNYFFTNFRFYKIVHSFF